MEEALIKSKIIKEKDLASLVSKSTVATVYTIGGLTLLGTFGLDTKPIMASLGVAGVSVGFAFKDVFNNVVCGVSLLLQKEFKSGDTIKVLSGHNIEGEVISIDYRYVKMRAGNSMILIPSQVVHSSTLEIVKRASDISK